MFDVSNLPTDEQLRTMILIWASAWIEAISFDEHKLSIALEFYGELFQLGWMPDSTWKWWIALQHKDF
jgi:hypothetical protein